MKRVTLRMKMTMMISPDSMRVMITSMMKKIKMMMMILHPKDLETII